MMDAGLGIGTVPQWISGVAAAVAVLMSVWAVLGRKQLEAIAELKREKATAIAALKVETDALKERFDRHDRRVTVMEEALRHLPDKESIASLRLEIEQLRGDIGKEMARLMGSMGPLQALATRLQDVMLEREK